jgi:hypothetical protein
MPPTQLDLITLETSSLVTQRYTLKYMNKAKSKTTIMTPQKPYLRRQALHEGWGEQPALLKDSRG